MNVRLRKTFDWYSGLVYEDRFLINHYTSTINLITNSDDPKQQNIAYERMKFWFQEILDGAIFIRSDHSDKNKWQETNAKILSFPDDPVDQLIGIMLCSKLNAIMENQIIVTEVEIRSRAGDDMGYLHSWTEDVGPLIQPGWWNESKPVHTNVNEKHDNVVPLSRSISWKDLGLDWEETQIHDNTVVFADFKKDETE